MQAREARAAAGRPAAAGADPEDAVAPDPAGVGPDPADPYSRLQYRRLIAWPTRIAREAPFLERLVTAGPEPSVLDLGCGTGEHARWLAARGCTVLGVDRSEAQIAAARDAGPMPGLEFTVGDLTRLPEVLGGRRFATALCLGNTLVHVLESAELEGVCRDLHAALLPGGAWLTQILNYEPILERGQRALPVNLREEADGETLVFLRLVQPLDGGRVRFVPTTLRLRPAADPPVEVVASHSVTLRAWRRADLEAALHGAGFAAVDVFGDLQGGAFDSRTSADLVFVAHRA
jgi:SAM-dependent methyltransferase